MQPRQLSLPVAVLFAALVHTALATSGALDKVFLPTLGSSEAPAVQDDATEVAVMSNEEVDALTREMHPTADLERDQKLEEARKADEDPDALGQVVSMPKPAVEIRPDKADFLSEYDSATAKQTRTRQATGAREAGVATSQPPRPPTNQKAGAMSDAGGAKGRGTGQQGSAAAGGERGSTRPDGFEGPVTPDGALPRKGTGGVGETAGNGDGRPLPKVKDLRPSDDQLSRAAGGGGVNDYLKDVEEGDETLLNSKRWKFASFFNRMKNQVAQHWHPDVAYRLRDPNGKIYGTKNRLTILRVSLDPKGGLKDVFLEKGSGVDFLDDEAESAFRAAEPFPNPPAALVDGTSGVISFRFGFLFEITTAPRFKIFRYND